jgi:hypothetical protein
MAKGGLILALAMVVAGWGVHGGPGPGVRICYRRSCRCSIEAMFCRRLPAGETTFPNSRTSPDPSIKRMSLTPDFCGRVEGRLLLHAFPNLTYIGFSQPCFSCLSFAKTPSRLELHHGCISQDSGISILNSLRSIYQIYGGGGSMPRMQDVAT